MLVAVVDVDAEAILIINYKVVDVVKAGVVLLFQLSIDLVALVDVISVAVVNVACVGNCCCALDANPIESVNLANLFAVSVFNNIVFVTVTVVVSVDAVVVVESSLKALLLLLILLIFRYSLAWYK